MNYEVGYVNRYDHEIILVIDLCDLFYKPRLKKRLIKRVIRFLEKNRIERGKQFVEEAVVSGGMFQAEQITKISASLTSAINNTLSMFIDLLPAMALICGVAFGIRFVKSLFGQVKHGK